MLGLEARVSRCYNLQTDLSSDAVVRAGFLAGHSQIVVNQALRAMKKRKHLN